MVGGYIWWNMPCEMKWSKVERVIYRGTYQVRWDGRRVYMVEHAR